MAIWGEKEAEGVSLWKGCRGAHGGRDQFDERSARPKEYIEYIPPDLTEEPMFEVVEIWYTNW